MAKGLIHVYTGDGKGKTTAAMGLAVRAAGQGRKVLILQFLKSRVKDSGVLMIADKTDIKVIKFKGQTSPLFDRSVRLSDLKGNIKKAFTFTRKEIKRDVYDMIILDEINSVLNKRYASMADFRALMAEKPERLEIIFTGRGAPEKLIQMADYVTEMRMIKHPYEKGVKARKGIEF